MKNSHFITLAALVLSLFTISSCEGNGVNNNSSGHETDSIKAADTVAPVKILHADPILNASAHVLAGLPLEETDSLYDLTQTEAWEHHAQVMDEMWANSKVTLDKVVTIRDNDLTDITAQAKTVFYSFSGPDFPFMATFFPKCDTYYMMGLERTGNPILRKGITAKTYKKIEDALEDLLGRSYFITSYMCSDLNNAEIDGTIPIFMVLIARMGYEIMSIDYQNLTADGGWEPSEKHTSYVRIRFFRKGEWKEKTLYYLSTNIEDPKFDSRVQAMIDKLDPETTVAFIKSCSYCLHYGNFVKIREDILKCSFAIVQDDTGITYNTLLERGWNVILYGKYTKPLDLFPKGVFQKSLDQAYATRDDIRPLDFRFGYNYKGSSMLVARKQKAETKAAE